MSRFPCFFPAWLVVWIGTLLIAAAFGQNQRVTNASLSSGSKLRSIAEAVALYRDEYNAYPPAERWFQLLTEPDAHGRPFVGAEYGADDWGNSFVYELSTGDSPPVVRCVGENGTDEHGTGDDMTSVAGSHSVTANDGYYWEQYRGTIRAMTKPTLIGLAIWSLAVCLIPFTRRRAVILLIVPLCIAHSIYCWLSEVHSCRVSLMPAGAPFAGLVAAAPIAWRLTPLFARLFERIARWFERVFPPPGPEKGLCAACGYDMRGLPGPVCPECGLPINPDYSEPSSASRG